MPNRAFLPTYKPPSWAPHYDYGGPLTSCVLLTEMSEWQSPLPIKNNLANNTQTINRP